MNTYHLLSKRKYLVMLDGVCASACTYMFNYLYLNNPKSVCITPNAEFYIHAASTRKALVDIDIYYVGKLQDLIDKNGGIAPNKSKLVLGYKELKKIYGDC